MRAGLLLGATISLTVLAACGGQDKVMNESDCIRMMEGNAQMLSGMMSSMMADSAMGAGMMQMMMESPGMRRMMMRHMMQDPEMHQEMMRMLGDMQGMQGMEGMEGMGGSQPPPKDS